MILHTSPCITDSPNCCSMSSKISVRDGAGVSAKSGIVPITALLPSYIGISVSSYYGAPKMRTHTNIYKKLYTKVTSGLPLLGHQPRGHTKVQPQEHQTKMETPKHQQGPKNDQQKKRPLFIHLYMDMLKEGTSANAGRHYQKLYARVTHIRGNRRSQPSRSAMKGPHPERTS